MDNKLFNTSYIIIDKLLNNGLKATDLIVSEFKTLTKQFFAFTSRDYNLKHIIKICINV